MCHPGSLNVTIYASLSQCSCYVTSNLFRIQHQGLFPKRCHFHLGNKEMSCLPSELSRFELLSRFLGRRWRWEQNTHLNAVDECESLAGSQGLKTLHLSRTSFVLSWSTHVVASFVLSWSTASFPFAVNIVLSKGERWVHWNTQDSTCTTWLCLCK